MTLKIKCPKCKKEVAWKDNKWRPFCSERCKMVDLGTWANEEYRVSDDADHVAIEDISSLNDD
jgi:endogenous inhibitor of DNA gyrase (YacG/DUF329 family)